jgi:hypothetical protein
MLVFCLGVLRQVKAKNHTDGEGSECTHVLKVYRILNKLNVFVQLNITIYVLCT